VGDTVLCNERGENLSAGRQCFAERGEKLGGGLYSVVC